MDIKQIQDLIRFVSKSGVNEVSLEQKDFKITIKTNQAPTVVHATVPAAPVHHIAEAPAVASAPAGPAGLVPGCLGTARPRRQARRD